MQRKKFVPSQHHKHGKKMLNILVLSSMSCVPAQILIIFKIMNAFRCQKSRVILTEAEILSNTYLTVVFGLRNILRRIF